MIAIGKYDEFIEGKKFVAGLYVRLSREDGDKVESNSVTSQKEILTEYVRQNPDIEIFGFYIDDGWSGTNFDRPGFQRMLDDIYNKKINCVIVKDLSRFGRNYTDSGYYTENLFVKLGVRFIALNNSYDSFSNNLNAASSLITIGVQNVINESVSATTSVNIRGTLNNNRKQGKFIGSFACYGYKKDPVDKHRLIIDETAAEIVRMIFDDYLNGDSVNTIVKRLNELEIPNPTQYKQQQGFNYNHNSGMKNSGLWCDRTVRRMLVNQMYIGNMVQGVNRKISYKIKECKAVPKEDWIVVQNTHEPIIDPKKFDKVQTMLNNKNVRTRTVKGEKSLFAGLVRCADCGRAMMKKTNHFDYGDYAYYRCVTNKKLHKSACKNHSIRIDELEKVVLNTIQVLIDVSISAEHLIAQINKKNNLNVTKNPMQKTLENAIFEKEKFEKMLVDLYPDLKSGVINQSMYSKLKAEFESKINDLDKTISNLNESINRFETGDFSQNEFLNSLKNVGNIEKLDRKILTELIDSILINEDNSITINFKFANAFAEIEEYISQNSNVKKSA